MWTVIAWVKDSPNISPVATLTTRSITLAYEIGKTFERLGFRSEIKNEALNQE